MSNPFSRKPTSDQLSKASKAKAVRSVQTSLFGRLANAYPHNRGKVAWCLIFAGLPKHHKHTESVHALYTVEKEELACLRDIVSGSGNAAVDDAWKDLTDSILFQIDLVRDEAKTPIRGEGMTSREGGPGAAAVGAPRAEPLSSSSAGAPRSSGMPEGMAMVGTRRLVDGVLGRCRSDAACRLVIKGTHTIVPLAEFEAADASALAEEARAAAPPPADVESSVRRRVVGLPSPEDVRRARAASITREDTE